MPRHEKASRYGPWYFSDHNLDTVRWLVSFRLVGHPHLPSLILSVVVPLRQVVEYLVPGSFGVDLDVALLVERTGVAVGGPGGEPHDVGLTIVTGEKLAAAIAAEQPMHAGRAVEAA